MTQKKKLTVQPEAPEAKKKPPDSLNEVMRKRGGERSKVAGKSTLPETSFPIVGIGASAGGLEALEIFLANVPAGSGMGFVIAQQLIHTKKDMTILHGLHLSINIFIPLDWQDHTGKSNGNSPS